MAEEPSLPSLPLAPPDDPLLPTGTGPPRRVRLHSSPPISSDPPFFSSDDDPSAENYTGINGRRKRKFRGPWYSQQAESSGERRPKRTFQRQFDSAVWLGSDRSEEDDDAVFSSHADSPIPPKSPLHLGLTRLSTVQGRGSETLREQPTPEELADKEIGLCLETGKEHIDLSSRGLTHISNSIIKPLSTIVSIPPSSSQGMSYNSLRPNLKLFLASNSLRRAPGELFNLENVIVLSLRSNLLVDLPSAIGRLRGLVELNIANNNLHFLPYEILQIFSEPSKLHSLTWHPNPYYEPYTGDSSPYRGGVPYPPDLRDGVLSQTGRPGAVSCGLPETNPKWHIKYRFRSFVRFMNIDGTLAKGPSFPRDESLFSSPPRQRNAPTSSHHFGPSISIPIAPPEDIPVPPKSSLLAKGNLASKSPSLLEVALKAWSASAHSHSLHQYLGYEPPERLARVTDDAKELCETEAQSRTCTVCNGRFVIPRTEWIEWWQISKVQPSRVLASAASPLRVMENRRDQVESMVPLMRRGCSWRCVPEKLELQGG